MATQRNNPYMSFNFQVDFSTGDATTVRGGFQEVSGMNIEVTSADYRAGNSPVNHPTKVNGVYKVGDVTFKRGLIGSTDLYDWVHAIRTGTRHIIPTVTVALQDEAHEGPVMVWKLLNARPTRYTAPSLNAKTGTDVAIEELVLSIEDLAIE
ncbi:MAG: phage tail protein [Marmoricola sp.]